MRYLILLLAAGASWGAELEFSHQLHLEELELECSVCHSSVQASDQAADHNLPQAELCLACHNGQTAPEIEVAGLREREPAERDFFFSHQQHLAFEDIAGKIAQAIDEGDYLGFVPDIRKELEGADNCTACHRGIRESAKVEGKVHMPQMSDCLVCHDQIDNPFSCEECHPADFQLKPDNHTREFIDLHSTGKMEYDKRTCQPCHGINFTCMGCH